MDYSEKYKIQKIYKKWLKISLKAYAQAKKIKNR